MSTDPVARMEQGIKITSWLWVLGLLLTAAGVGLLMSGIGGRERVRLEQVLFVGWALGPPAWFVVQHRLWPTAAGGHDRARSYQALVKSIWGGMIALLAAVIFGRWG